MLKNSQTSVYSDQFLTRLIYVSGIMVSIFMILLGWIVFRVNKSAETSIENTVRIEEDLSRVLYLDMVLSGFARTAVTTGEMRWENRYDVVETKLQESLERIFSMVPDKKGEILFNETQIASKNLRYKEKLSFSLLRDGVKKQAFDLLYSESYEHDREVYYKLLEQLGKFIKDYEQSLISQGKKELVRTVVILAIVFPVIFVSGFTLYRLLNRWQKNLRSLNLRLERMLYQSETLVRFSRKVSLLNFDQLKQVSKEMLPSLFRSELFSIFLLDSSNHTLKLILHNHADWEDLREPFVVPENKSVMWDAVKSQKQMRIEKYSESVYFVPGQIERYENERAVCIPLLAGNSVVGVLNLNAISDDGMSDEVLAGIQRVADHLALAINNILLYERNEQLVVTDELTRLFNRRYLYQELSKEILRTKRYDEKLSVLMIDLDHFKKVNDTYGHGVGDIVLKTAAEQLSYTLRQTDSACRFGGEEFVVILPGTNGQDTIKFAERLRLGLAAQTIEYETGKTLNVTASIGVTEYKKGDNMDTLLARADSALYEAKEQGRNRCVCKF